MSQFSDSTSIDLPVCSLNKAEFEVAVTQFPLLDFWPNWIFTYAANVTWSSEYVWQKLADGGLVLKKKSACHSQVK